MERMCIGRTFQVDSAETVKACDEKLLEYTQYTPARLNPGNAWVLLVIDQQLPISAMTEHEQIVICCSVTSENHAGQAKPRSLDTWTQT